MPNALTFWPPSPGASQQPGSGEEAQDLAELPLPAIKQIGVPGVKGG